MTDLWEFNLSWDRFFDLDSGESGKLARFGQNTGAVTFGMDATLDGFGITKMGKNIHRRQTSNKLGPYEELMDANKKALTNSSNSTSNGKWSDGTWGCGQPAMRFSRNQLGSTWCEGKSLIYSFFLQIRCAPPPGFSRDMKFGMDTQGEISNRVIRVIFEFPPLSRTVGEQVPRGYNDVSK